MRQGAGAVWVHAPERGWFGPAIRYRNGPSLRAGDALLSEAIQGERPSSGLLHQRQPCCRGFAMTGDRYLNGTRPEACSLVLLSRLATDF
ncbi:MAG: hypothetical protein LBT00_06885 [Spirochaetaceae bacterium]|nr:hypothetical protein [Spirochaetaceae bacterium]